MINAYESAYSRWWRQDRSPFQMDAVTDILRGGTFMISGVQKYIWKYSPEIVTPIMFFLRRLTHGPTVARIHVYYYSKS